MYLVLCLLLFVCSYAGVILKSAFRRVLLFVFALDHKKQNSPKRLPNGSRHTQTAMAMARRETKWHRNRLASFTSLEEHIFGREVFHCICGLGLAIATEIQPIRHRLNSCCEAGTRQPEFAIFLIQWFFFLHSTDYTHFRTQTADRWHIAR